MSSRGLHIIGDLWGCNLSALPVVSDGCEALQRRVSTLLAEHRLTELGNFYHFFAPQAVTATITLSESHLAFHSWPEDSFVSVDLFVCNYTGDNSGRARALFQQLNAELFQPSRSEIQEVERFYRARSEKEKRYGNS